MKMKWEGYVACMGEMRNVYRMWVRKPEGRRPLRRLRQRWEDNIRMNIIKIVWEGEDFI
jgi:hypothetical protein